MTRFMKQGNTFQVAADAAIDIREALPPGTYTVKFNPMANSFYLEVIEDFVFNSKVYGDTHNRVERILSTFADRPNSTGVMLTGEKGSGKTLLSKILSITARERDIPTIVINQPWVGEEFNGFMQVIDQPVVVVFDEFEKVYDKDDQEKLLTLLDGVYPTKKLFVITTNDKYRVDQHMRNRPGRIYYRFDYEGLEPEFIREYCEDNLVNKSHIESMCKIASIFGEFNFDMLKAMVEEMNRYNESPQDVMKVLNAKPENAEPVTYDVKFETQRKGKVVGADQRWRGNPVAGEVNISYYIDSADDDVDDDYYTARFTAADLKLLDPVTRTFEFANGEGEKVTLTKQVVVQSYNYDAL